MKYRGIDRPEIAHRGDCRGPVVRQSNQNRVSIYSARSSLVLWVAASWKGVIKVFCSAPFLQIGQLPVSYRETDACLRSRRLSFIYSCLKMSVFLRESGLCWLSIQAETLHCILEIEILCWNHFLPRSWFHMQFFIPVKLYLLETLFNFNFAAFLRSGTSYPCDSPTKK